MGNVKKSITCVINILKDKTEINVRKKLIEEIVADSVLNLLKCNLVSSIYTCSHINYLMIPWKRQEVAVEEIYLGGGLIGFLMRRSLSQ